MHLHYGHSWHAWVFFCGKMLAATSATSAFGFHGNIELGHRNMATLMGMTCHQWWRSRYRPDKWIEYGFLRTR